MPYIRHYFPQVLVSSRRIKMRERIPKASSYIQLCIKQLFHDPMARSLCYESNSNIAQLRGCKTKRFTPTNMLKRMNSLIVHN